MNNQPIHILNRMGIIASFSIAKKISEKTVLKYFAKYKKQGKTNDEIQKMFVAKIESDIFKAMKTCKVPGLEPASKVKSTSSELSEKEILVKKIIVGISHKLMHQNFNKHTLCYVIDCLVDLLNLSDEDFKEFHRLNQEEGGIDDDSDEGNDEEDGGPNGTV